MTVKRRNLFQVGLAVAFLVGAVLACEPSPSAGAVTVVISSPGDGSTVTVGQEVQIDSTVTAAAGVEQVDLSIGGQVVRHDTPPTQGLTTFRVVQAWTPTSEGRVTVSVVAYDANRASGQATITLQVVGSGAGVSTPGPGSVVPPEPTVAPPPVATEVECTLDSSYVADVTIPDGTVMSPGAAFVKAWKVKNSGTCDWGAGYELVFVSGEQMSGPPSVPLPAVTAGDDVDVAVNLVAPSTYGTHKGTWRIRSDEGIMFGTSLTVWIEVPAPATDTPPPTAVPTDTPLPTATPFGGGSGRIAYVSFRDGNAEIYVMKENDAAPARLTNNPEIDDWPDWSPDGTKIAFTRYSGGKPDIFVMNADGSSQVNLTNNADWDTGPSWSPDGRIVFASNRVGGALQIWVMNADGSGATQLTDTSGLSTSPAWSPNGNRIAFESTRDGQREIYVMNADGTGQTRLTFTGNNYGPEWSPNGARIAFSSKDGLWVMKSDGTQLMQLTTNAGPLIFDLHPHWTPDGTHIIFDSKRDGNGDLWAVRADGTGLQKLTTNSADDMNPACQR